MSYGVARRCSLDPTLLWLWCRLAATAPIGLLAWEPPYAAGAALKRQDRERDRQTDDTKPRQGCGQPQPSGLVVGRVKGSRPLGEAEGSRFPRLKLGDPLPGSSRLRETGRVPTKGPQEASQKFC